MPTAADQVAPAVSLAALSIANATISALARLGVLSTADVDGIYENVLGVLENYPGGQSEMILEARQIVEGVAAGVVAQRRAEQS